MVITECWGLEDLEAFADWRDAAKTSPKTKRAAF
jgi:hypothetical protein